ncbi:MAG: potassium channel family protein [Pseudomonadota bacterium]
MISKVSRKLWAEDLGLTGLLVILLLETFVIYPFIDSNFGGFAMHLVFLGVLITGVMAVSQTPHWARVVAIIAALGLGSHYWGYVYPSSKALFISLGFRTLLSATLIAVILMHVFKRGPITYRRIAGSIAAYMLTAILFGYLYLIVFTINPQAFNIDIPKYSGNLHALMGSLTYFSYTTMTSVGFGDILPLSPSARALSMLEALIGQLFPAILLARLVSLEIEYNQRRSKVEQQY